MSHNTQSRKKSHSSGALCDGAVAEAVVEVEREAVPGEPSVRVKDLDQWFLIFIL